MKSADTRSAHKPSLTLEQRCHRPIMDTPESLASMMAKVENRDGRQLLRRLYYFWLVVILAILVVGCISTSSNDPALWYSWRGPLMVLLCSGVAGWYLLLFLLGGRFRNQLPLPLKYGTILLGYVLVAGLLAFSTDFVGLVFALMGMSMSVLSPWQAILPVGMAILMYLNAIHLLPFTGQHQSLSDMIGSWFGLVMSVGTVLAITALIRERFQREALFLQLSKAHRELSEAHCCLRVSAAREADLATLRERNRLAREMHDSLGHALVSISIKLEAVRMLYPIDADRADAEIAETTTLVRSTMTELRQSLAGLRPAALEEHPLNDVLVEMTHTLAQRVGVAATCTIAAQATLLDRETQEVLYRVGQEALTNVAKHAAAQHVTLSLSVHDGLAVLEVSDDGAGLGAATPSGERMRAGFGLRGMRERVEELGGVLTLGPRPGSGTILRATIPAEVG